MTALHPIVREAIPALAAGLEARIGSYQGLVRADQDGQALTGHTFTETGGLRLAMPSAAPDEPNGPWLHHRFTVRGDAPGIELDITVTNGEVEGPRTPHLSTTKLFLDAPPGMAIIPRFDWIRVDHQGGRTYCVDLGGPVLQGVLYDVALALVPDWFVTDQGVHPSVDYMLERLPWLREGGPGFVDGLPRLNLARTFELVQGSDPRENSPDAAYLDWIEGDADDYLEWKYGGATGGMSIRFDFGAEWDAEFRPEAVYHLMHRWSHEIHRRPQRCYLTRNGEPLEPDDAPAGFNFVVGPTQAMFPNGQGNVFGFDERSPLLASAKGAIDLAHATRWFGPDAYLAQVFGCPIATERIRRMAGAARCDIPDPMNVGKGLLGRAHGWCAVLQAVAVHTSRRNGWSGPDHLAADRWLYRFVEACLRDQTDAGGLCSWTHNKEARDYARDFVWDLMDPDERPSSSAALPIEPVTQSYQETILAWGLWCAREAGTVVPVTLMHQLLEFICDTQRAEGAPGPWYRTTTLGERRSTNASTFYHGTALAMAKREGIPGVDEWIRDFTGGAPDPLAWLRSRKASDWRNRWTLMGLLEEEGA